MRPGDTSEEGTGRQHVRSRFHGVRTNLDWAELKRRRDERDISVRDWDAIRRRQEQRR